MNEEGNKSFMKYSMGRLAEDHGIGPQQSDKSRSTNSTANITKPNIKCKDSLEQFQNANSNRGKTTDCTELSDFKGSKVLNSLKMGLEGTLNCVNFIRQSVHENILAKTNEKHNLRYLFEKPMYHGSQKTNDIDLKSADIFKDNSLCNKDEMANESNLINKENEQTTTDKINYNSNEIIYNDFIDYSILNTSTQKDIKSINQPNSLSGINCVSQEKLMMISLLSEDEECESDSNNISASCVGGGNNKTPLTSQEEHSVNTKSNLVPTQNENRVEKNEVNGNQQKTVEKRSKNPEKRSEEFDRHVKKKRIVEVDGMFCQPKGFDFCGVFYKVKLTNLHPRINYGHIASLLQKADLDFIDILLVNSGSYRSFAEISFTDSAAREKAVSLDKTLSHLGMKIKIKAI